MAQLDQVTCIPFSAAEQKGLHFPGSTPAGCSSQVSPDHFIAGCSWRPALITVFKGALFKQGSLPCSWNPLQDSINQKSHPWLGASQMQTTAPRQRWKRLEQSPTPSEITSNRRNWGPKDLPMVIVTHRQRWSNRGLKSTLGHLFHISLIDTWGPLQYKWAGTHVLSIAPRNTPSPRLGVFCFCFLFWSKVLG